MILTSAGSLAAPYILKIVIDEVFPSGDFEFLLRILAILVGINIVRIVVSFWSDYLYEWVSNHIVLDLRSDLFNHLIHLPMSFFDANKTGDLIHRINSEVNSVQNMLTGSLIRFVNNFFTLLGLTIALCWLNWKLFAISMVVIPFVFINTKYFQPKIHAIIKKAREKDSEILNFFIERFENIRLIKSYVRYGYENNKLTTKINELIGMNLMNVKLSSGTRSISTFFVTLAPILIFLQGGKEVMYGAMTLGSLVAFIQYLNRLFNPLRDIMSLYWDLVRSSVSMQRIFEFMSEPVEEVTGKRLTVNSGNGNRFLGIGNSASLQYSVFGNQNKISSIHNLHSIVPNSKCLIPNNLSQMPFKFEKNIQFKNIYFKYDGHWILNNLNLEFKNGKKYAIVGSSGCGKSTVINLLNRFYEPQEGEILIDGKALNSFGLNELRRGIALVTQDNQLFHDSIWENIRYGDFDSTKENIYEAAKLTAIYDHAVSLKEGFNSKIGDKGTKISGGQKQRIAISRAILKQAELIVLDEATSALDSESEKQIFLNLSNIYKDKTMIMISHRLSTIRDVDEIIYLDKGQVVERGTYSRLIKKKGLFWDLFKEQVESAEDGNRRRGRSER